MTPFPEALPILYEDEFLVAVHKPAGLLVHRSSLDAHEPDALLQRLRDQVGYRVQPVHRLDKPTSGIVVLGRTPEATEALFRAFAAREVDKRYEAVVRGWMSDEGVIDHALGPTPDSRRSGPKRDAVTSFVTLDRFEVPEPVSRYSTARSSHVRLEPHTGRTHQLRRHMKHVFHPIVGDRRYGDDAHNRFFLRRFDSDRLLLACVRMAFDHPVSGRPVVIECPLAADLDRVLGGLASFRVPG